MSSPAEKIFVFLPAAGRIANLPGGRLFAGSLTNDFGKFLRRKLGKMLAFARQLLIDLDRRLRHPFMRLLGAAEFKSIFVIPGNHAII